jgi:hypothetical protein
MAKDSRRLFAFGCSYTNYVSGPTWADFLNFDFDHVENWALPGIGCRAIAERIAECHAKNNFTKDDIVIVQWSTHLRHDYHTSLDVHFEPGMNNMGWKTAGSIFNEVNIKLHDKRFLKTFFYEPSYIMHCLNHILLVQELLEKIGCTWYMTSIGDWCKLSSDLDYLTGNFEQLHQQPLSIQENLPEYMPWVKKIWEERADRWLMPIAIYAANEMPDDFQYFRDIRRPQDRQREQHPNCTQHVGWLNLHLRPKLNLGEPPKEQNLWCETINTLQKKYYMNQKKFWDLITKPTIDEDLWWPNDPYMWPLAHRGY